MTAGPTRREPAKQTTNMAEATPYINHFSSPGLIDCCKGLWETEDRKEEEGGEEMKRRMLGADGGDAKRKQRGSLFGTVMGRLEVSTFVTSQVGGFTGGMMGWISQLGTSPLVMSQLGVYSQG